MAIVLGNRAKMSTSTTGTGTITLGSALSGYQTFAQAGITNGQTVRYAIEDGTNFEIGSGVYTSSGTTLTRSVTESSNSDSAITLSGSAEVFVTATVADLFINDGASNLTTTGVGTFASLDISGDVDVDGTTNLDAVDIDGAVNIAADLTIASTNKILFNDASQFIQGSSTTVLTIAATDEIDLTATTIDINGAVALNGAITGATNITLSGELDAATGDFSGDVDVDGTLEADAITVNGTALATVIAGTTVTNATNSAHVLVTDNESTNEENLIAFVEGATSSTGNVGLEMDGNFAYNPSTGTVSATVFKGNIDAVDGDFDGTLEADAITLNGTAVTATATLDTGISNNNVPKFTSGVADNDFLRVDGTAIEGRSASEVLSDIAAAPAAGSSNIVTTGALNSGSITSGFGAINNGSSNITTTGVGTFGSLDISGNIDIDGTTNLDAVDIDGAVQLDATLTVGVDDTGYDVKFFGDTASAFMQWDASADDLILGGAAGLIVPEGQITIASTAMTSSAADLNQLDGEVAKTAGKESIYVPATAMYPSTTNPCSDLTQVETTALRPDLKVLDFADGADDFAQFSVAFPKSWNEGTVTFQPFWTVTGTNTGTVAWQLAGVAITNDESINTAFGTQVATTALAFSGTSNDLMVSAESGAVTIAGSPAAADMCFFQINRDISADTQTGDARLLGVKLLFTTDAANDA
jgi:hypothetical protein